MDPMKEAHQTGVGLQIKWTIWLIEAWVMKSVIDQFTDMKPEWLYELVTTDKVKHETDET